MVRAECEIRFIHPSPTVQHYLIMCKSQALKSGSFPKIVNVQTWIFKDLYGMFVLEERCRLSKIWVIFRVVVKAAAKITNG